MRYVVSDVKIETPREMSVCLHVRQSPPVAHRLVVLTTENRSRALSGQPFDSLLDVPFQFDAQGAARLPITVPAGDYHALVLWDVAGRTLLIDLDQPPSDVEIIRAAAAR